MTEVVNPYYAAARGYIDEVIDPRATRATIIEGLTLLASSAPRLAPRKHGNVPL